MELNIKDLQQQNTAQLVRSLELVTASILESVTKTTQTACSATPEMQALFEQWIELTGSAIVAEAEKDSTLDPAKIAREIGITPETVLSLIFTLHRQGKLRIKNVTAEPSDDPNREICGCLRRKA